MVWERSLTGAEAFSAQLEAAMPLSDCFFEHFTSKIDTASLDGRAKLVQQAQPLIASMPEGVFRDMMIERLESLAQHRLQGPSGRRGQQPVRRGKPVQQRTPMRLALAHLVQNPSLAGQLDELDDLEGLGKDDIQGVEIFRELVDFCTERPNITTAQLVELWHEHPALPHLQKLAVWDLPGDEEVQAREFVDAVNRIRLGWVETLLSRVGNVIEQQEEYRALQRRQQALKKKLVEVGILPADACATPDSFPPSAEAIITARRMLRSITIPR